MYLKRGPYFNPGEPAFLEGCPRPPLHVFWETGLWDKYDPV